MKEKENLVDEACKALNCSQRELAEKLNVNYQTVNKWKTSNMSDVAKSLLINYLENQKLKNQVKSIKNFYKTLKELD